MSIFKKVQYLEIINMRGIYGRDNFNYSSGSKKYSFFKISFQEKIMDRIIFCGERIKSPYFLSKK